MNKLFDDSRDRLGSRELAKNLREEGINIGRERTRRLMKRLNLSVKQRIAYKVQLGAQYTSQCFRNVLEGYGIRSSMGDVGARSATDHALHYLLHPCSCGIMQLLSAFWVALNTIGYLK